MVGFICMGLLDLWGTRVEREYKMNKSCPQRDSNPKPSAYEANTLNFALLISIEHLKLERLLPECAF